LKLSVIIPVYNEAITLAEILKRIRAVDVEKEIIMIDDFSTDGTKNILEGLKGEDGKVFYHEKNIGKCAALKTGFAQATGDYIVVQDADLEYNPQDYQLLLKAINENEAVVVYGSRFRGLRWPDNMTILNWFANKFLTFMTNLLYGTCLSDMETCYKLFRSDIIKNINIESDRFGFEPEITTKLLNRGIVIHEVAISYSGRTSLEGKKIGWGDGFYALWLLIKYRLIG
jgi:glycosyltransferase involved in cell wall biosynthesis